MDPVQYTIIVISIVLTILMVFVGVQVFYILAEVRRSVQKMNKMLDDAGKMTGSVSHTVEGMSGLVSGMKAGLALFSGLHKKGDHDD